jgi:hypothetical protein
VGYIKRKHGKFHSTKINGWVDMARYLMTKGPYAVTELEPERHAAID